jgi:hypothetical protein
MSDETAATRLWRDPVQIRDQEEMMLGHRFALPRTRWRS